jgi:nucleoside-diphosphate-sugar epimerase
MKDKILIIGACGQVGTDLTLSLHQMYGTDGVVASDIVQAVPALQGITYERVNVMDAHGLAVLVDKHKVTQIYHLAAVLSAKGEQNPLWAWRINMEGLINILEIAKEKKLHKVFFPSSIAVFGNDAPKLNAPQHTPLNPTTVYGISKVAGEHWCNYFYEKYKIDVRSLRYPGLISYKAQPGGGTTDYAVDIFYKAKKEGKYTCFLTENTALPMMYIDDAVQATLQLMHAPTDKISIRHSYNVNGMTFTPKEIAAAIQKIMPEFEIDYAPDFRQQIADSWCASLDDTTAQADWNWKPKYDLEKMTQEMWQNI